MITCPKCSGSGALPMFVHVEGGMCFMCRGTGQVEEQTCYQHEQDLSEIARIFHLHKQQDDGTYLWCSIYIWPEDANSPRAGMGFCFDAVVTERSTTTVAESIGYVEEGGVRLAPLAVMRDIWRDRIADGLVLDADGSWCRDVLDPVIERQQWDF